MAKVACHADLCYNTKRIKWLTSAMLVTSARLRHIRWRNASMDILSSNTPQKQCTKCGRTFPFTSDFFPRNGKDVLRPNCRECHRASNNARYHSPENHEHILAQVKTYRDRPEIREYRRNALKEWHQRPDVKARQRAYMQAYKSAHYSDPENRERLRVSTRAYSTRPDVREHRRPMERTYSSRRRAMKKAIAGTYTPEQIQQKLKAQKHRCYYCSSKFETKDGKHIYHIDHTFPLNRVQGTDIPANDINYLVLACPTCNARKNDKFPWEWSEGGRLL